MFTWCLSHASAVSHPRFADVSVMLRWCRNHILVVSWSCFGGVLLVFGGSLIHVLYFCRVLVVSSRSCCADVSYFLLVSRSQVPGRFGGVSAMLWWCLPALMFGRFLRRVSAVSQSYLAMFWTLVYTGCKICVDVLHNIALLHKVVIPCLVHVYIFVGERWHVPLIM